MSTPSSPSGGIFGRMIRPYTDLLRLPRAFWIVVFTFAVESTAYFGALTLMTTYLGRELGWGDALAGMTVSVFTMLVTLFMLGAGSYAESFGLRRAIIAALLLCSAGRMGYCLAYGQPVGAAVPLVLVSLLIVALGEAILQPVCYSGVKQYTDERTSAMGYGLIYAIMNAGIFVIGTISSEVRPAVQSLIDARLPAATAATAASNAASAASTASASSGWLERMYAAVSHAWEPVNAWLTEHAYRPLAQVTRSGVDAVNWVCVGITVLTLLGFLLFLTRRAEAAKLRPDNAELLRKTDKRPLGERMAAFFGDGPFSNTRFLFFIFMLLPVRTLFAHQWLTMPTYILRAYSPDVGNNMEKLVNWINPGIIFFGVPLITAMTRRVNVYTMMILGSLVSAVPTFLLCGGPNLYWLITYFVVFSIGEAMWSARFLEYASELAPEGRIAQYMGLANIPWLLAKGTTGFYSGAMLNHFCPDGTPAAQLHTQQMWFIYGCIALASPLGLWMARKWVMAGLYAKPVAAA